MFKNFLKTTFRNLSKNKVYTLVNLVGLCLGITAAIVIFKMTSFLMSYNTYHTNYDRIYRPVTEDQYNGRIDHYVGVPNPMADALREDFPEFTIAHVNNFRAGRIEVMKENGEKETIEEWSGLAYMDKEFLEIFDWKFLKGNKQTALDNPNSVVLSEKFALKYFGTIEAIGKSIKLDQKHDLKVTGVMENYPNNSDFPFEALIPFSLVKEEQLKHGWGSVSSDDQIYLMIPEGKQASDYAERIQLFLEKNYDDLEETQQKLILQPLADLHFNPDYPNYSYQSVSKESIWAMVLIGIFLVLTSCVNFVNLSTALAVKRSKEVGVRKVLGGKKKQLLFQFFGETGTLTGISLLISLGLAELSFLKINPFLDTDFSLNLGQDFQLILFLVALFSVITLLAGFYPAKIISGFKPALALKNGITNKHAGGLSLRKVLVVFQFVISQFFIIGSIVVMQQMDFFLHADMGFDTEEVFVIRLPNTDKTKADGFKAGLVQHSNIQSVTLAYTAPASGSISETDLVYLEDGEHYPTELKYGDKDYIETFGIELLAGENLVDSDSSTHVLVNEQQIAQLGITSPAEALGKFVRIYGKEMPISGVVKDFNTRSLQEKIYPMVLLNGRHATHTAGIRVSTKNLDTTLDYIKEQYKTFFPDYKYRSGFLSDHIAEFYESERQMTQMLNIFSLIAILIGCLGLFGLVSYLAELKMKEIGIRKVLGASVSSIIILFSKEFLILVGIAFIIAAPISWVLLNQWLESYAYHIQFGMEIFALSIAAALLIAWITAGYHSVKAASSNPIKSLRNE